MSFGDVHILAVLVAAILKMALGAFWYSPKVFGDVWAGSALTSKVEDIKATPTHYAAEGVVSLLMALILALFINWINPMDLGEGILVGFMLWLGFIATTQLSGVIWGKLPVKAYLVNTGYVLLSLVIMSAVLTLWR